MRFTQFLREKQKPIHLAMLFIAVALFVLHSTGIDMPPNLTTTVAFSVVAYILSDISQNTYSYSRNKLYRQEVDLLPDLIKLIEDKGAREAQLIQYSGQMVSWILRKLLDKGAAVTLWLEDEQSAISAQQKERIKSSISNLPGETQVTGHCSLMAYYYQVPASIRGILIDKKVLVIGWYTYEHVLNPSASYQHDKVEISGHDRPCWILYEGTPEFSILKDMFESQLANFAINQKDKDLPPVIQVPAPNHALQPTP